jgi:3-dehydroquinate synthase
MSSSNPLTKRAHLIAQSTLHTTTTNNNNNAPVLIKLDGNRSYPIVFSSISNLGQVLLSNNVASTNKKAVLVSNSLVGKLKHTSEALNSLKNSGWDVKYIEIPDGEVFKTPETYTKLIDDLLSAKIDRKSLIIGLGGGVTTDIVGFAAATVLRGVNFVNVPTTLLAMVDASVGGKTGVNTKQGKNLLGAFWQPSLVLASMDALETLSLDEYNCGMGEVVKHAVLEETGEFFSWLEENAINLSRGPQQPDNKDVLAYAVRRCCEIKGAVVSEDEREDGKRALLNLGHTVGHAIEHVMGFGNIPHGVAVAIGTVAEARLAELRGEAEEVGLARRIAKLLTALNLPYHLELNQQVTIDALLDAVFMDKKREGALITITVPRKIGDVRLVKVKPDELRKAFETLGESKGLLDGNSSINQKL